MASNLKPYTMLRDYVTGRDVPNIGAEENRQAVERHLVEHKGYHREDIRVDAPIELIIRGEAYRSQLDLVVTVDATAVMVIKCPAGSLGSWERQTVAAARIFGAHPIPYAVVSDGQTALVTNTLTGGKIGEGIDAIPSKTEARQSIAAAGRQPLPEERHERESLIFRTYDRESVNVQRKLS